MQHVMEKMMTEETAKALAEAMNRLAAAIENLPRDVMGIRVSHSGYTGGAGVAPSTPVYGPSGSWGRGFSSSP